MASRLTAIIVVAIVAVTLIAGLIVGAQRDDDTGPVDLLILNGRVYPADGRGTLAEAVAIRANQILRIGSNRELKRLRGLGTKVIDAHGGAVLPGFNDSHLHFLSGGLSLDNLNLLSAMTWEEMGRAIQSYAGQHPDREWILGRGWCSAPSSGSLPTRQQLDALVPDRPTYLTCDDGHTGWANSQAIALARITRKTPNPKNGVVVKDPRTGEPTGILKEAAQELVRNVLPQPTREQKLNALRQAIAQAHMHGITSIQNASSTAEEFELYDELWRLGELNVRVYSALSIEPGFTAADADRFDEVWRRFPDDPLFKTGAVKLVADGVVHAHTAAMLAPYVNKRTAGHMNFSPDELERVVPMMDRRGWQILIHAAGDAAVRAALDAFEHAGAVNPAPARGRRHRIEHIETLDAADVERFAKLQVIASQQPWQADPGMNRLDVWASHIGPDRASRGWAWPAIKRAGGRLAFGSDWPAFTLDPRVGLQVAVTRTRPAGEPGGGSGHVSGPALDGPDERLPLDALIDAYTSGAAYASFDEQRKGTLAREMLADVVILSADIFSLPPERVLDAQVAVTVFDGKIVYEREHALTN